MALPLDLQTKMDGKMTGMISYKQAKEIRERDINFKGGGRKRWKKQQGENIIVGEECDKCGCAGA